MLNTVCRVMGMTMMALAAATVLLAGTFGEWSGDIVLCQQGDSML